MDAKDAQDVFRQLSEYLNEHGFQWIVREVNSQIASGRLEQRKVKVAKPVEDGNFEPLLISTEDDVPIQRYAEGSKATFVVAIPYSPKEQLHILLDAIERVFVDSARIERDTRHLVEAEDLGIEQIRFLEPDRDAEAATLTIREAAPAFLDTFIDELMGLLNRLRQEVRS